jgi:hypothetical protein
MTFDFFYISGSLVVPSVDHLNMNRTINYEDKLFFEMELISGHKHPQIEETSNTYTIMILNYRR